MNNEPVAWRCNKFYENQDGWFYNENEIGEPLYTHPVKCNKCNDTEWVCENHPNQEAHKCIHCGGAGMPCECTHPAELTDEEILKQLEIVIGSEKFEFSHDPMWINFARAILRKASEK